MIDLTGKRFGRLSVISKASISGKLAWDCFCDCGNKRTVRSKYLHAGNVRSCGCLRRERCKSGVASFKHGYSKHYLYGIWSGMHERCRNKKVSSYPRYGGRGIKVCERWHDFKNFADDMGERPHSTDSIDRIDNDGDYEPGNCRWVDVQTQCRNRGNSHILSCDGEEKTIAEWAEITGIGYDVIKNRVDKLGWTHEDAIKVPVNLLYSFTCCECGTQFESNSSHAKYCRQKCKARAANRRNGPSAKKRYREKQRPIF